MNSFISLIKFNTVKYVMTTSHKIIGILYGYIGYILRAIMNRLVIYNYILLSLVKIGVIIFVNVIYYIVRIVKVVYNIIVNILIGSLNNITTSKYYRNNDYYNNNNNSITIDLVILYFAILLLSQLSMWSSITSCISNLGLSIISIINNCLSYVCSKLLHILDNYYIYISCVLSISTSICVRALSWVKDNCVDNLIVTIICVLVFILIVNYVYILYYNINILNYSSNIGLYIFLYLVTLMLCDIVLFLMIIYLMYYYNKLLTSYMLINKSSYNMLLVGGISSESHTESHSNSDDNTSDSASDNTIHTYKYNNIH